MKCNPLLGAAVFALVLGSSAAHGQYARTVSRANCATPTIPMLSPSTGLTFNESISWDPKFWAGHYAAVTSQHIWSRWIGGKWTGHWDDRVEATYRAGRLTAKTWRAWAGKVSRYRNVTVFGTKAGYRSVEGIHVEKIPGSTRVVTFYTEAWNCNITRW